MKETQLKLVSFELAKMAKEAGFEWECELYYMDSSNIFNF